MSANFLHATDLGSDTDDDDYVPDDKEAAELSVEEGSGDDEDGGEGGKSKVKKKKKAKKAKAAGPASFASEETAKDAEETEQMRKEFEREKEEKKEEAEKKKVDDLWADFKSDVSSTSKPKPRSSAGSGLGSLSCLTAASTSSSKSTSSVKSSASSSAPAKPRSIVSSIFDSIGKKDDTPAAPKAKPAAESPQNADKVKISQVFDFAGEAVEVTKEVAKDSKEAKKFLNKQEQTVPSASSAGQKRPGGLSSIMNVISGKKQKMGCLDKSKLDWNKFVDDEGIKDELSTFNRGKDGFVEKQQFLERADQRRFELEKEAREKTRKTLNR